MQHTSRQETFLRCVREERNERLQKLRIRKEPRYRMLGSLNPDQIKSLLAFNRGRYGNRRDFEFSDDAGDHTQYLSCRRRIRTRDRRSQVVSAFLNCADNDGVAIIESSDMTTRLHRRLPINNQEVPTGDIQGGECVALNLQTGDVSAFEHR